MIPAKPSPGEDKITLQNVARIDAQNERLSIPLRDFFTEYGYHVVINQSARVQADYHIVYGDNEYVKRIFATLSNPEAKRLAVVSDENEEIFTHVTFSGKIVVVDPVPLSKETVQTIFQFFFTSPDSHLDLRKNPKKHIPQVLRGARNTTPHVTGKQPHSDNTKHDFHEPSPKNIEISKIFSPTVVHDDATRIDDIMTSIFSSVKKPTAPERKRRWSLVVSGLVFLVILPFLWFVVTMGATIAALGYAAFMLRSGHVAAASAGSSLAEASIRQSEGTFRFIVQPFTLIGAGKYIEGQEHMISFLSDLSSSLGGVSKVFLTGKSVADLLMSKVGGSGQIISPAQQVETLRIELFSVQTNIGLAQSRLRMMLQEKSFPFWFGFTQDLGERVSGSLDRYGRSIADVDKLLVLYPYVSGFRQKQTYLVLFQNSLELRPTGGFIGTIGILNAEDGTLSNVDIQDVYVIDGQLRGHVDPPGPIRELLGSEHWYLRDSNWDANFSGSAARAAWFYEKETGIHVDGVIGMNTPIIVNLLSATGPITLRDYNDRITSQNFYGKTLFYTSADFFPGSTQKQNFLGSFARALLDQLTNNKHISPIGMFKIMTDGFLQHDLMFYFADPELEKLVEGFGWSARVFSREGCAGVARESCFFDPLYVNEANLGVNKANYFIKRSLTRTIIVGQDGSLAETSILSLINSSRGKPQDSGGTYRVYIRYFLPSDAIVDRVDMGGVAVAERNPKDKTQPVIPYFEFLQGDSASLAKTLGVAVDIRSGDSQRISVAYRRNRKLQVGLGGSVVEVFTQKQPGVSDTPVDIFIQYPPDWNTSGLSEGQLHQGKPFLAKEGSLEYNTTLSRDSDARILIEK